MLIFKQALLFVLALAAITNSAADDEQDLRPVPALCSLEFRITSANLLLISGGAGSGLVTCRSGEGIVVSQALVHIAIEGIGLGLGGFSYRGIIANLGLLDPREVPGQYAVIDANAGFILAAGANFALKSQQNGLSLAGSVQAGAGIGAGAYGRVWTISLKKQPLFFYP